MTSGDTLRRQTGLGQVDRVKHFKTAFPAASMNTALLRKIYAKHRIKKKKYRYHKQPKDNDPAKQKQLLTTMK